eukprot:14159693-Alexandrium_andersonii.AAC.1
MRPRPTAEISTPWEAGAGPVRRSRACPDSRVPGALRAVAFGPSIAASSPACLGSASMVIPVSVHRIT